MDPCNGIVCYPKNLLEKQLGDNRTRLKDAEVRSLILSYIFQKSQESEPFSNTRHNMSSVLFSTKSEGLVDFDQLEIEEMIAPDLTHLNLVSPKKSNETLLKKIDWSKISSLSIKIDPSIEKSLLLILENVIKSNLTSLSIKDSPRFDDLHFKQLAELTKLTKLCLIQCPSITDDGLAGYLKLQKITSLVSLTIKKCDQVSNYKDITVHTPNLRAIKLSGTIFDSDLGFSHLTKLRKLVLSSFTLYNVNHLALLTSLRELKFKQCPKITEFSFVPMIDKLTNLIKLKLQDCGWISKNYSWLNNWLNEGNSLADWRRYGQASSSTSDEETVSTESDEERVSTDEIVVMY